MLKLILISFLFLLACPSTQAGVESEERSFQQSLVDFKQRNFAESREILTQLVRKKPTNALYWFNLGNSQYMLKEFTEAAKSYLRVEELRSALASAAKLYRAKCARAQSEYASSAALLKQLLDDPAAPTAIRAEASTDLQLNNDLQLKEQALTLYRKSRLRESLATLGRIARPDENVQILQGLAAQRLEKDSSIQTPAWTFIDFSAGTNSNPYLDAESEAPARKSFARTSFGAAREVLRFDENWSSFASYRFDWLEFANAGDLKITSHQVALGLRGTSNDHELQIGPVLGVENWGGSPALIEFGARLSWIRKLTSAEFGAGSEIRVVKPQASYLGHMNGTKALTDIFYTHRSPRLLARLALDLETESHDDLIYTDGAVLPSEFLGWGPSARLIWNPMDAWIFNLTTRYQMRSYPKPSQPGTKTRSDQQLALTATGTRSLTNQLSAYLQTEWIRNQSTLGPTDVRDVNYWVDTHSIGLVWDFQ